MRNTNRYSTSRLLSPCITHTARCAAVSEVLRFITIQLIYILLLRYFVHFYLPPLSIPHSSNTQIPPQNLFLIFFLHLKDCVGLGKKKLATLYLCEYISRFWSIFILNLFPYLYFLPLGSCLTVFGYSFSHHETKLVTEVPISP